MIGKRFNKDSVALVYITVLTVIALVYGFTVIPSPLSARNMSQDHKRIVDLGTLQNAIDANYKANNVLPSSLATLSSSSSYQSLNTIDSQTKQPYGYHITSPTTYKLCATFQTDSSKEDPNVYDINNPDYSTYQNSFTHPAGYYCFTEKETSPTGIIVLPRTTYIPRSEASPSAILSSFNNSGDCQWTPTFQLKGFAPYSQIRAYATGALADTCSGKTNQKETESTQLNQQTDAQGNVLLEYPHQLYYGEYTYTFTDSEGNSASIHFTYNSSSLRPTIIPSQAGGVGL